MNFFFRKISGGLWCKENWKPYTVFLERRTSAKVYESVWTSIYKGQREKYIPFVFNVCEYQVNFILNKILTLQSSDSERDLLDVKSIANFVKGLPVWESSVSKLAYAYGDFKFFSLFNVLTKRHMSGM